MDRNEAIKIVKGYYPVNKQILNEALKFLIPELKESEGENADEKVRKALIKLVTNHASMDLFIEYDIHLDEALSWLEKQGKNNMGISESVKQKLESNLSKALEKETPESWNKFLDEQKPGDKAEPKFHVNEWIVTDQNDVVQIKAVNNGYYTIDNGMDFNMPYVDRYWHKWTIKDAKAGDVLSYRDGQWCFIYKGIVTEDTFKYYALLSEKGITVNDAAFSLLASCIIPATKEQCNLLFQKIHEAGYEWNAEKKELGKIEQEENVELTDFESALFSAFSYAWQEYLSGKEVNVAKWAREHSAELLEVARGQKPACAWSEEDERSIRDSIFYLKNAKKYFEKDNDILWDEKGFNLCIEWLESLYKRPQPLQQWSEEDETYLDHIITAIKSYYTDDKGKENPWRNELLRWLKSLKDRVQPQQEWGEEDEYNVAFIVETLLGLDGDKEYSLKYKSMANWLKSLRPQKQIRQQCADFYNKDSELQMPRLTAFENELANILFDREYDGSTETEDDIQRGKLEYELAAIRLAPKLQSLINIEQKSAWSEENEPKQESIEYTRTDAFIDDFVEKSWDWIEDNILSSNQQDKSNLYCEQFRNYIKGITDKDKICRR